MGKNIKKIINLIISTQYKKFLLYLLDSIDQEPPPTKTHSKILVQTSDLYALTSLKPHKTMSADGIGLSFYRDVL